MMEDVKKTASDTVDRAKEQASQVNTQAQQQLNLVGSCELALDTPLTIKAAYVTLIPAGAGRPAVLQFKSYVKPQDETPPSFLLQSPVNVGTLAELAGQTVQGQIWIQADGAGNLWSGKAEPIELKIVSLDDKQLQAEFAGGTLRNVLSGAEAAAAGKLTAVISPWTP